MIWIEYALTSRVTAPLLRRTLATAAGRADHAPRARRPLAPGRSSRRRSSPGINTRVAAAGTWMWRSIHCWRHQRRDRDGQHLQRERESHVRCQFGPATGAAHAPPGGRSHSEYVPLLSGMAHRLSGNQSDGRTTETSVDRNHLARHKTARGRDQEPGHTGHIVGRAPAVQQRLATGPLLPILERLPRPTRCGSSPAPGS